MQTGEVDMHEFRHQIYHAYMRLNDFETKGSIYDGIKVKLGQYLFLSLKSRGHLGNR